MATKRQLTINDTQKPILNETYSGEYYMVKEDYKTIYYKENDL